MVWSTRGPAAARLGLRGFVLVSVVGCFDEAPSTSETGDVSTTTGTTSTTGTSSSTDPETSGGPSTSTTGDTSSGVADSSTSETSTTEADSSSDSGTTGTDSCELEPGVAWVDEFERPDSDDIGNCWIEKEPTVWDLAGSQVVSQGIGNTQYFDHLVWRDVSVLDAEVSIVVHFDFADIRNEPHPMVRIQPETLEDGGYYHAYALVPHATNGGEPLQLCLMRFDNRPGIGEENCMSLQQPLQGLPLIYRLTLSATGNGPVQVMGRIDQSADNGDSWSMVAQHAWIDASADRITDAGAVGFSGGTEIGVLDNFAIESASILELP